MSDPRPGPLSDLSVNETAQALIATAERILTALANAPDLDLADPVTFLALQLIGPIMARAVGDDPRRSMENLIEIAELLDVDQLRAFLRR